MQNPRGNIPRFYAISDEHQRACNLIEVTANERNQKAQAAVQAQIAFIQSMEPDLEREADKLKGHQTDKGTVSDAAKTLARGCIEAALFISDKPVSVEDLCTKLEIPKSLVIELLEDFYKGHWETNLQVVRIGEDKYTMQIRPEYTQKVKKFASGGLIPEEVMRTLTIIALKQPILLTFLVRVRGSGAFEHVKNLVDRGLARAEKGERDQTITTTDQFADMFGLNREVEKMKEQLKAQLGIKE